MPPTLYTHQDECIDEMYATKKKVNLCKLFCGTGKTLIFTTYLVEKKYNLVVIAFPKKKPKH
jgi:superfamily II DNA or RNA helicase